MQTCIYTLPEVTFVGGKTQELYFTLVDKDGERFDAKGCAVDFSLCNYSNKVGTPLFSLTPQIIVSESGIRDTVYVSLPAKKTTELFGKYIYQITIMDISGKIDIPNQGIMNITRNINTNFVNLYN